MIIPVINDLAIIHDDVNFIKVNVDQLQELAQDYRILSIPTLVIFQDGKELERRTGFATGNEIEQSLLS